MNSDEQRLKGYLIELGFDLVPHYLNGGTSLLAHSLGVSHLMQAKGCSEELCRAGLFHQIYGVQSPGIPILQLSLENRDEVRDLIGERAERLVYLNCALDRVSFDRVLGQETEPYRFIDLFKHEEAQVLQEDFDDVCRIHLYDWLEQVARIGAYDYRRPAYRQMAARLGAVALEAFDVAYAPDPGKGRVASER